METNFKIFFKDIKRWEKDELFLYSTICEHVLMNVQCSILHNLLKPIPTLKPFLQNNPKSVVKQFIDIWIKGMTQNWKQNQHTINVDSSRVIVKHPYLLCVSYLYGCYYRRNVNDDKHNRNG